MDYSKTMNFLLKGEDNSMHAMFFHPLFNILLHFLAYGAGRVGGNTQSYPRLPADRAAPNPHQPGWGRGDGGAVLSRWDKICLPIWEAQCSRWL